MPPESNGPVEIGFVARAHGVRGELRVVTHDPASTSLSRAEAVTIGGQRYRVRSARPVDGAFLLAVDGISDRDVAERMRGAAVSVDRDALDLQDGELLLSDLVGCRVELKDGTPWGRVAEIMPGVQDLLVIHDGPVERLLPLVDEFLIEVDLPGGRIVVDPPEGLPEDPR